MSLTDMIRLVRELGPIWGVVMFVLLVVSALGRYRWELGNNTFKGLLKDPVFVIVVLTLVGGLAVYLPLYYVLYERRRGLPQAFTRNEIGILIAEIPDDADRKLQQSYAQAIRALAMETAQLADRVRVRLIERLLPHDPDRQHNEAVRVGRQLNATFVLRAIRVEAGHQVWVSNVNLPEFGKTETHLGKIHERQLAELETAALPNQVTLLARCALAFSFYRSENFEQAGKLLQELIELPELPPGSPSRPYLLQMLGNSLFNRRFSDPTSLLPAAIAAYDETLAEWNREKNPEDWADTMINRGMAYVFLPGPVRTSNLTEALRSSDCATEVYNREREPERWARAMTVRGMAKLNMPDQSSVRESIETFDRILEIFIRKQFPYEWATSMQNRGFGYHRLGTPDEVKEAARSYGLALEVLTRENRPIDWARVIANRASLFLTNPDVLGDSEEFEEAVLSLELAEQVFTRDHCPMEWAGIKALRGIWHFLLHLSEPNDVENGKESIRLFNATLEVLTPDQFPIEYARLMSGRGVAYEQLAGSDSDAHLNEAIRSYRAAATIFEAQGFQSEAANSRVLLAQAEERQKPQTGRRTEV